ncbi:hypothetical protein ACSFB8_10855 [Enterococcus faecalis]
MDQKKGQKMKARSILLIVALATLALIGLSQLREVTDDIKFPAKYFINLTSDQPQTNSTAIHQLLRENSNKSQQNLFRTYLNDQGNERNFAFLSTSKNKQKFETNLKELANVSFAGSYYSDKPFTEGSLQSLKRYGVRVEMVELQWYLVGPALWTEGIRAVGLWSLVLSIFFAYFSLLYLYRKNSYVARFMGVSAKFSVNNWLIDSVVIMLTSVSLFLLFWLITKNTLFSMASLSFLSVLVVNALLLLFLILLGNLLFHHLTKYGNILTILKGMNAPALINVIWFTGIIATLLVIPFILNKINDEQAILKEQLQGLEPWQQLESYRTLTVTLQSNVQVNNGQIDVSGELEFGKTFMSYFSEHDYIFAQKSAAILPQNLPEEQKKEILANYAKDNIDPKITKRVIYMNEQAYQINAQLQKENIKKKTLQAPATIYLPAKYKLDSDSVINATYMEFFQDSEIKRTDFEVVVVPNGRKTFLFDYHGAELYQYNNSRTQYGQDEIVVILNMNTALSTPSALTMYGNITDGLFSAKALARLSSNITLTKNISEVISPYKSIKLKINRLKDRINSAKLAVIVLILVQFILVLQFFTGLLKQHLKEISVKRLLGINLNKVLLKTFSNYLFFLLLTFLIAFIITNDVSIKYLVFVGSSLEIGAIFFILKRTVAKRTSDFLKGDIEI